MKTLDALYMQQAAERVQQVENLPFKKEYGALCHNFPVMVRQCGLAQAVAFSLAKAGDDSKLAQAHKRVCEDVKALLGYRAAEVHTKEMMDYLLATRRVLKAWIFYKRFAESLLHVKAGDEPDDEEPEGVYE